MIPHRGAAGIGIGSPYGTFKFIQILPILDVLQKLVTLIFLVEHKPGLVVIVFSPKVLIYHGQVQRLEKSTVHIFLCIVVLFCRVVVQAFLNV